MYRYFISYSVDVRGLYVSFDNTIINLETKIETEEDLRKIEKMISDTRKKSPDDIYFVRIINFKKMD